MRRSGSSETSPGKPDRQCNQIHADQREVVVGLGKVGNQAKLTVHDTGPGIPIEDLPHVFERFYRGEKSRTRSRDGKGFGLGFRLLIGLYATTAAGLKSTRRRIRARHLLSGYPLPKAIVKVDLNGSY